MRGASEHTENSSLEPNSTTPKLAIATLFVLILANISSLLDRSIMSLMVRPIQSDLMINDVEFGLLHGFAFALLYTVLGVPIGWLVDRFHRLRIVAIGISIWSLMTALSGLAHNFLTLFLARMGVGVGEASLNPAAYSILSDLFSRRYLARAIGAFMMATYVGVGLSYVLGGALVSMFDGTPVLSLPVLGDTKTWKVIFFIAAAPGFILALALLMLPEPKRKVPRLEQQHAERGADKAPSDATLPVFIKRNKKSLITHFLGFVGSVTFANGLLLWAPTLINTNHGVPIGVVGQQFGLALMVVGGAGPFIGGWLADVADRRGVKSAPIKVSIFLSMLSILPAIAFPWVSSLLVMYFLLSSTILVLTAQIGLAITALQLITPNELRGQVSAIFLMLVNIVGIGFGPALIPWIGSLLEPMSASLNLSVSLLGGLTAVLSVVSLSAGVKAYQRSDDMMGFE